VGACAFRRRRIALQRNTKDGLSSPPGTVDCGPMFAHCFFTFVCCNADFRLWANLSGSSFAQKPNRQILDKRTRTMSHSSTLHHPADKSPATSSGGLSRRKLR
jgi:hypothetical protein